MSNGKITREEFRKSGLEKNLVERMILVEQLEKGEITGEEFNERYKEFQEEGWETIEDSGIDYFDPFAPSYPYDINSSNVFEELMMDEGDKRDDVSLSKNAELIGTYRDSELKNSDLQGAIETIEKTFGVKDKAQEQEGKKNDK